MTTIGIIGAGEVGSQIVRATTANGDRVVIANSRGRKALRGLADELGPPARAGIAAGATEAGDVVVIAVPLRLVDDMPVEQFAGPIVLDANNYMAWRDGHDPTVVSREGTVHELRQEQHPPRWWQRRSPTSKPCVSPFRPSRRALLATTRCRSPATTPKP